MAERTGIPVAAVSWKHSDRIAAEALGGEPAWTLDRWVRDQVAHGERHFIFVPFFISPQGAIGSALRTDLEKLAQTLRTAGSSDATGRDFSPSPGAASPAFEFTFTGGLGLALTDILVDRIREAIATRSLDRPPVVVVDHGGPSPASAALRNAQAAEVRARIGDSVNTVVAASMESPDGPGFEFNQPLLSEVLLDPSFAGGETVIAPLFLGPGRHAGPNGDLAQIAQEAEAQRAGLHCHFADLVGTHSRVAEIFSSALLAAAAPPIFVSPQGLERAAPLAQAAQSA
jgi:hypothetical protein